jgi:hypothetical protein
MALDLVNYEKKTKKAVATFWASRTQARDKQLAAGKNDQGERAGVTGGKNMNGFLDLITDLVKANGLAQAEIHQKRTVMTLPGTSAPPKSGICSSSTKASSLPPSNSKARSALPSATTSTTAPKKPSVLRTIFGRPTVKALSANNPAPSSAG